MILDILWNTKTQVSFSLCETAGHQLVSVYINDEFRDLEIIYNKIWHEIRHSEVIIFFTRYILPPIGRELMTFVPETINSGSATQP